MRCIALLVGLFLTCVSSAAYSGTVTVKGTHLCCGGCQAGAEEALSEVTGISDISCDVNTKIISYKAANDEMAAAGIKALAAAGFYGKATHDAKQLAFPDPGSKPGMKANSILLAGLHLCCTACVTASQKALEDVTGVSLIDIDRNEGTIKLTGDSIEVPAAIAALNKAGFYCRLPKKPKLQHPAACMRGTARTDVRAIWAICIIPIQADSREQVADLQPGHNRARYDHWDFRFESVVMRRHVMRRVGRRDRIFKYFDLSFG